MAIIKCNECKKEVSNTATTCPHCGAAVKRKPIGCGTAIAFLFLAVVLIFVFTSMSRSLSSDSATAAVSAAPVKISNAVACDRPAAQKVKDLVQGLAKTSQDNGFIRVQWGNDFHAWGKDRQLQMAQTFANADACLSGAAREIRFYSPAGQFNAVATPTAGIRLID